MPPNGKPRWIPRTPRRPRKRLPPMNSPRPWRCNGRPWSRTAAAISAGKNGGERVLSQEEIDNLLGFNVGDVNLDDHSGIRAIINSAMVSYERLPMLEIVFDRLVRLMTTSLRNFTSDNVEVSLDRITSVRFGDYMNSIPLARRAQRVQGRGVGKLWPRYGGFQPDLFDDRRACSAVAAARPRCASRAGPTPRSKPTSSSGWSRWCWPMPSRRSGRCRR